MAYQMARLPIAMGHCFCDYTFSRFDTKLACDGQTHGHMTMAYTMLAKRRMVMTGSFVHCSIL